MAKKYHIRNVLNFGKNYKKTHFKFYLNQVKSKDNHEKLTKLLEQFE